jgi:hypothetical protein
VGRPWSVARAVPRSRPTFAPLAAILRRVGSRPRLAAAVLFLALAVAHTWPLAAAPGYWSRNDNGDTLLNEWALAWVARTLPTHPLDLYDANIFYPEKRTLAYSEHLVVQGALVIPVFLLGGSPVLAFNLALIAGFALTGWAFCLLLHRWTGSWAAGVVAGSLVAFNANVLMRLPHLQAQHVEFFAVALVGLDQVLTQRRARGAGLIGLGHALQGFAGVCVFVFTSFGLLFATLARPGDWLGRGRGRTVLLLLGGVALAAFLFSPALWEYASVHRELGFERSADEARFYAAGWEEYLYTGSRLYWPLWGHRFSGAANFPGFTCLALVGIACWSGIAWRDRRARMAAAIALGCALLSIAPRTPVYPYLHAAVPLLRMVRATAHFGHIALVGFGMLAGFGVLVLERRHGARWWWPAAVVGLVLLVNGEALRAPYAYTPFQGLPPAYAALAREPRAVVAEVPMSPPRDAFGNARYLLAATVHWHPILAGYSGFTPASYDRAFAAMRTFPDAASLDYLRRLGVTHVVVHRDRMTGPGGEAQVARIEHEAALALMARSPGIDVFRLTPP